MKFTRCLVLFLSIVLNTGFQTSFIFSSATAQEPGDTLWTRTYGGDSSDRAYSVQQTNDGGYIVAGHTQSFGEGNADFYLVKTDAIGNTIWTRTYGGSGWEAARSVQQTTDEGYIVAGEEHSIDPSGDMYLVKTDAIGDTIWTRTYGGSDAEEAWSVQQTTDEGYIVAGYTRSFGMGTDFYLVKTDSVGDTIWTQTYGGGGTEEAFSVQQTFDKGYIIAGNTNSFGAGSGDMYVIKTDSLGNTVWDTTYGGSDNERANSIKQTEDGGYIIAGYTASSPFSMGDKDFWLLKTDTVGDTIWTETYGGSNEDIAWSVHQTDEGGYIVAGFTRSFGAGISDFYLVKTDTSGDTLWTRTYGGIQIDECVSLDICSMGPTGGYILAGYTFSFGPSTPDSDNFYLVRVTDEPFSPLSVTVVSDTTEVARGDTLCFTATVTNNMDSTISFEGWTEVTTPGGGRTISPVLGPVNGILGPSASFSPHICQQVPGNVPLGGPYTYCVLVGTFPDEVIAEDCFEFFIVPQAAGQWQRQQHFEDWTLLSEDVPFFMNTLE